MSKSSSLKGAIFEWFVKNILKSCGFVEVKPDKKIIYDDSPGLMIHGLGQPHNADVLMYPPFQIPFYFPTRLLVECKAYTGQVGLPIVRGVLGLREDINSFEIVTPTILKNRQNYRTKKITAYPYDRFSYQVGLATVNNVSGPAQDFALTHHIPIISFYSSSRYQFFRDFISAVDDNYCESLGERYEAALSFFKKNGAAISSDNPEDDLNLFIQHAKEIFKHMYIGVLEDGTILFLYSSTAKFKTKPIEIKSKIHWKTEDGEWQINIGDEYNPSEVPLNNLYFELPPKMYNSWADKKFDKREAINLKEKKFKRITVFSTHKKELLFFILNLDADFIRRAKRNLNNESD